jgi:hypothetical protein
VATIDLTEGASADFLAAINRHGYAFQQAVAENVSQMAGAQRTRWHVESNEFPVSTGDSVAHIDLILRAGQSNTYRVGECKRVDPALGRWCFARSKVWGTLGINYVVLEQLAPHASSKLDSSPFVFPWSREPFSIAVETRTKGQGDGVGGSRDAIDRAVTQVLRGVNGLANHFYRKDWASLSGTRFRFVPAVFTTADLWVSESDLRKTDLASGTFPSAGFSATPADWLWFNYNLSPALRHNVPNSGNPETMIDFLIAESTRSVAIVSMRGMETFLSTNFLD